MALLLGGSDTAQENTWSNRLAERFVQETDYGSQPSTLGGEAPDYSDRLAESYIQYRGEGFDIGPRQAEPGQGITQGAAADSMPRPEDLAKPVAQRDQPAQGGGATSASTAGSPALPEKFQWVKDPAKLSAFMADFNKKNPLNPANASQATQDVYANMKAPATNYGPPTGANLDAAKYWANYFGFPDQYANNKVSVESKDNAKAWVPHTQAAGLEQVRPVAAADVGFDFGPRDAKGNLINPEDAETFRRAMEDPTFASMLGAMNSRKALNIANGDPFRAEAGYNAGFGTLRRADREGRSWPSSGYVNEMFPGQWGGNKR